MKRYLVYLCYYKQEDTSLESHGLEMRLMTTKTT